MIIFFRDKTICHRFYHLEMSCTNQPMLDYDAAVCLCASLLLLNFLTYTYFY